MSARITFVIFLFGGLALAQAAPAPNNPKPTNKNVVATLDDVPELPKKPVTPPQPAASKAKRGSRNAPKPTAAPTPEDTPPPAPPVAPPPAKHEPENSNADSAKDQAGDSGKASSTESNAEDAAAKEQDAKAQAEIEAKLEALNQSKTDADARMAAAIAEAEAEAASRAAAAQQGISVRVENLQTPKGDIKADQVKLSAPFAPKPFAPPPAGWKLESSTKAPSFKREVEISPGVRIKLDVHPHLLLPASSDTEAVGVNEPGFDPLQGYRQVTTVGAILSNSVSQLDRDAIALGDAIDRLQQILVALPQDTPEPPPAPAEPDPAVEALRQTPRKSIRR